MLQLTSIGKARNKCATTSANVSCGRTKGIVANYAYNLGPEDTVVVIVVVFS